MSTQEVVLWIVSFLAGLIPTLLTKGRWEQLKKETVNGDVGRTPSSWEDDFTLPSDRKKPTTSGDWRAESLRDEAFAIVGGIAAVVVAVFITYYWMIASAEASGVELTPAKLSALKSYLIGRALLAAGLGVFIAFWRKIRERMPEKQRKAANKAFTNWISRFIPWILGISVLGLIGWTLWSSLPWWAQLFIQFGLIIAACLVPVGLIRAMLFGGKGGSGETLQTVGAAMGAAALFGDKGKGDKKEDPDEKKEKLEKQVATALETKNTDDRIATDVEDARDTAKGRRRKLVTDRDLAKDTLATIDRLLSGEITARQAVVDTEAAVETASEDERAALDLIASAKTDDEKKKAQTQLSTARGKLRTARSRAEATRVRIDEIERAKLDRVDARRKLQEAEEALDLADTEIERLAQRANSLRKAADKSDDDYRRLKRELDRL